MSQKEVILEMAKISGVSVSSAKKILENASEAIINTLKKDKKATIVGIGRIEVCDRKKRVSILKGVEYETPARKAPKFSFSKKVKDSVKEIKYDS